MQVMKRLLGLLLICSLSVCCINAEKYLPILFWHAVSENCCSNDTMKFINLMKNGLENNVHIASVKMGNTVDEDYRNSLRWHPFDQIKYVCDKLQSNPIFKNGYNGVGFLQGALLLRGLAQVCPFPPMRVLISIGGPQQGLTQLPQCGEFFDPLGYDCIKIHQATNKIAYQPILQKFLAAASYWHDPYDEERYRKGSTFLALINNENTINEQYKRNLMSLKKLVLVKLLTDEVIVPNDSAWFGFFGKDKNGAAIIVPLEESELYKQDKIGLRQMNKEKKLKFIGSVTTHFNFDELWFQNNIIKFLKEVY